MHTRRRCQGTLAPWYSNIMLYINNVVCSSSPLSNAIPNVIPGKTQKWDAHDDDNDDVFDDDDEEGKSGKKKKGKSGAGTHKIKAEKVSDEPTHPVLSTVFSMVDTDVINEVYLSSSLRTYQVYFFDYNTVESVLLGCAVIVCLSGVMFENERFTDRTDVAWEKEIMTWGVFGVIFGSILYYIIVFISEVFGYTPKCIVRMCTNKKLRHKHNEKKDGLGDLKMHNMTSNPLSSRQLEKMSRVKKETESKKERETQLVEMSPVQTDKKAGGNFMQVRKGSTPCVCVCMCVCVCVCVCVGCV